MTTVNISTGFVLGLFILVATELSAENKFSKAVTTSADSNKKAIISTRIATDGADKTRIRKKFSYRPPTRGAPAVRIGGGTRGIGAQVLELIVFAPDHTGLTTKEQPTFYWYASAPVLSKLELTIINDTNIEPVLEQLIATSGSAGIQSFDLSKTKIKLKPGLEYRWFVSAVADMQQRSNDVVASGMIKRVVPDTKLDEAVEGADETALVEIYANGGIWYDAIDSLSQMVKKSPDDSDLLEQRAAILEQVGLQSAADYIRKK